MCMGALTKTTAEIITRQYAPLVEAAREYLSEWIDVRYADCEDLALTNTAKTLAISALATLILAQRLDAVTQATPAIQREAKIAALRWAAMNGTVG